MKRLFIVAALTATVAAPAFAADVGVSVNVGQPGFYGRIDIGNAPPPQLIYSQPVVIEQAPANAAPVYLYVPAYQTKEWRKYCRKYAACSEPVYFVQQTWYEGVYAPRYRHARPQPQILYAHDIHSDVVRAGVIRAHDIHAENVHARVVYRVDGEPGGPHGEDIHAPAVGASEIDAHDIHARVVEADTLYVHDLHSDR
ncbi:MULTISPECIES: hypothetical protein [Paraburkholderia]|nr:hypothetical protein [Paraburkholderia hospita]EIN01315.1 hypothetical protein WQE_09669 [Paraburkholderia hospita]OUL83700.1 hypothetical protein CA601_27390 [Paraburkholderia hospita]OUL83891.1 hypothetical protein CA602_21065 [Paraburkholderia hospita]OUL95919.1 hypothetical protein CA603_06890 [Paraburkholderia hospita]SEI28696.1 hypothetical protein SAMN05192544_11691 [Paraburkholderia hospita]